MAARQFFFAAAGGASAAGAFALSNYTLRGVLVSSDSRAAFLLKQLGLVLALGLGSYKMAKARWVPMEFAFGAVGMLSVMSVLTVAVVPQLPAGSVAGFFPRGAVR